LEIYQRGPGQIVRENHIGHCLGGPGHSQREPHWPLSRRSRKHSEREPQWTLSKRTKTLSQREPHWTLSKRTIGHIGHYKREQNESHIGHCQREENDNHIGHCRRVLGHILIIINIIYYFICYCIVNCHILETYITFYILLLLPFKCLLGAS